MFPHTVTIYNKDSAEKYHKTIIEGVLWDSIKGVVNRRTGSTSADSLRLIVPCSVKNYMDYMDSEKWLLLGEKAPFWTLKPKDIVILGSCEADIKSAKDISNLQNAMLITSVDFKKIGSKLDHFEVSGK